MESERLLCSSHQEGGDSDWSHFGRDKNTVTIFSRDDESCYSWLITFLRTFLHEYEIKTCFISSTTSGTFRAASSSCYFAILYHTKKRGRVNICNVVDALYDEELELLFNINRKENVIVLIDDLDDPSPEMKTSIQRNQPNIQKYAEHLHLCGQNEATKPSKVKDLKKIIHKRREDQCCQAVQASDNNIMNSSVYQSFAGGAVIISLGYVIHIILGKMSTWY